jgi:CRP-like cAMP-binding protein
MATVDRSLIADLPLFAGLEADALDDILKDARAVRHAKNDAVFEQGAAVDAVFVLLNGHARAAKTTPGGHMALIGAAGVAADVPREDRADRAAVRSSVRAGCQAGPGHQGSHADRA